MILWLTGLLNFRLNRIKLLILTIISIFFNILFVGTYVDNHGDTELLIKYKPTYKFIFYSPVYHYRSDSTKVFTNIELEEEKLYNEYVNGKKSNILTVLTLVNIQLLFTFLCSLILDLKFKNEISILHLLIHIVFCILFTIFYFQILNYYYELFFSFPEFIVPFILLSFIVLFNLTTILIINKFKNISKFIKLLFGKVRKTEYKI